MAILKIARMGHPVLRRRADPVTDPTAPEVIRLVGDMLETMLDADGAGLAAPQVHVPLRLVVFHIPLGRANAADDDALDGPMPVTVLVNPEIEILDHAVEHDWEGCLSVPGLTGEVPRARRIRYRWLKPTGEMAVREASGFHARVVQHECDHLDGILYPMRMTDLSRLGFVKEVMRERRTATASAASEPVAAQ